MDETDLEARGWERLPTRVFSASIGPTWVKGPPGARTVALLADDRIANDHMGIVHGGALMTFSDIALGVAVADAIGEPRCITVQLQYQFAAAAAVGSLITCEPEVVRKTSRMVFARGLVKSGDKIVGSTEGIFSILDPAAMERMRAS